MVYLKIIEAICLGDEAIFATMIGALSYQQT